MHTITRTRDGTPNRTVRIHPGILSSGDEPLLVARTTVVVMVVVVVVMVVVVVVMMVVVVVVVADVRLVRKRVQGIGRVGVRAVTMCAYNST